MYKYGWGEKHTHTDITQRVSHSLLETNFLVIIHLYFRKSIIKTARECNRKRNEMLQFFFMMFHTQKEK